MQHPQRPSSHHNDCEGLNDKRGFAECGGLATGADIE